MSRFCSQMTSLNIKALDIQKTKSDHAPFLHMETFLNEDLKLNLLFIHPKIRQQCWHQKSELLFTVSLQQIYLLNFDKYDNKCGCVKATTLP